MAGVFAAYNLPARVRYRLCGTATLVTGQASPDPRISVVIATRNRSSELLTTLDRLQALPEKPRIVVVDNASSDGTTDTVRRRYPEVDLVPLSKNLGGAARNAGVELVDTPYVAFADDDSWWAPGALAKAADLLDDYPRLAALAARILVGPEEKEDSICREMAVSPLPLEKDLPGPPVLGFLGCAVVVRRAAYLEAGGYDRRLLVGGEEELLAADLAAAGWGLAYVKEVEAHHHPSKSRDPAERRRSGVRNTLWFTWLRRPLSTVARHTWSAARAAAGDAGVRAGFVEALRGLPWVVRERRVLPNSIEEDLRRLDGERGLRAVN